MICWGIIPKWAPERPTVGIAPKLSDAELVTLAVIQALLGYTSEARFLRYAYAHLGTLVPLSAHPTGPNKRLRRSTGVMQHIINKPSSRTKATDGPASSKPSTRGGASPSSDPPPKQNNPDPDGSSSARSARPSNRSTTPSKPNSISNGTADVPNQAS